MKTFSKQSAVPSYLKQYSIRFMKAKCSLLFDGSCNETRRVLTKRLRLRVVILIVVYATSYAIPMLFESNKSMYKQFMFLDGRSIKNMAVVVCLK